MKKSNIIFSLIIALGFNISTTIGQDFNQANRWSVGLNFGGHEALKPVQTRTKFFTHVAGDVKYMVNNRFGVMGDLGYENFAWKTDTINNTHLSRISLQGVMNMGDILRFNTWTNTFGLQIHGGAGIGNMWQKDKFSFAKGDLIGNFIVGIAPQIKINDRISANLDWSFVFNSRQHRQFDFKSRADLTGVNAFYMTASAGIAISLGKNEKSAFWIPTEYGSTKNDHSNDYLKKIEQLENQLKDDDNDGVINSRDLEPNTPADAIVNSKGVTITLPVDSDNDGIIDAYDKCPNDKGTFSANGCPDADGDGVIDSEDRCPKTAGSRSNNGCPIIAKETQQTFDQALNGIQFETNKDIIQPACYAILDKVVNVLKFNPDYHIEIHGHTDNTGEDQLNEILSSDRAKAVKAYIVAKGVDKERISTFGHGSSTPVASNETTEGKAKNRRVEFLVR